MITVESVSKKFADASKKEALTAVNDLDLQLQKGEFIAITGRSGSGKSTLLGMMGGISRPTAGVIRVNGVDQWSLTDDAHADFRNRNIGFVFQFASLLPTLRAVDNVALPAIMNGLLSQAQAYARARALLERVGLGERCNHYPGQLSGGEQRRVAIARALVNSPEVLLADEPTADLDEETEAEILNLLIDIKSAHGLTLVVVTHNRTIAQRADRELKMRAGRLVSIDSARQSSELRDEHLTSNSCAAASTSGLSDIFDIPASVAAKQDVSLGAGLDRFVGQFVLWTVPIVALIWAINYGVAYYQDGILEAKAAARQALEELAMKDLRAEVQDITFAGGNSYRLDLYLRNTAGTKPIFVMTPTVRAFVQVGSSWQEIPLRALTPTRAPQVSKITGNQLFSYTFEPDVSDFAQLLPYYMHVRISNDMLVSPSSQPKDDLIERSDNYYVYLKPHGADNKAILKKLRFPGAPPVWIPMPPH